MRLIIRHKIEDSLKLPLNYHHILQAIIYNSMKHFTNYSDFLHDEGFGVGKRNYKMFTFGLLNGRYTIRGKDIIFFDEVSFEVRSPDVFLIRLLAQNIMDNGICYLSQRFEKVDVYIADTTIEIEEMLIQMNSPICVYSTDEGSRKTYYYNPDEDYFSEMVQKNFFRKYTAYYGIEPQSNIYIEPVKVTPKDKYVTKYNGIYIGAWKGIYNLSGQRKYLDFLFNTGIGSKNSQGFGMFNILD